MWRLLPIVLLAACEGSPRFLQSHGQTLILIVGEDAQTRTITVIADPSEHAPIEARGSRVQALFYYASVEQLGLKVGRLAEDARGRSLPLPNDAFEASAAYEDWRRLESFPEELALLRVRSVDPCVVLGTRAYPIPNTAGSVLGVVERWGTDQALMQVGANWLVAGADSASAFDGLPAVPAYKTFYDGATGETWIFMIGALWVGSPSAGFRSAPPPPFVPRAVTGRIDNGADTTPFELFATTSSIALWRFDGDAWSQLAPPLGNFNERAELAWIAPGQVVSTATGRAEVAEYLGNGWRIDLLDLAVPSGTDRFSRFRSLRGWGPLLGTENGALFHRVGSGWQVLVRPSSSVEIRVIEPIDQGLLFGGTDGVINQAHGVIECEPEQYGTYQDQAVRAIVPSGTNFLLLAGSPPGVDLQVIKLERRR